MSEHRIAAVLAACTFCVITSAEAGTLPGKHPMLNKRFAVSLGGFFPDIDSKVRLDANDFDLGTEIDFENTLGLEETKNVWWANARWRISRRNNLEFEWNRLNRDAVIGGSTRELEIGDSVVQAGAAIDSQFDINLFRLTYGYSLIRSDEAEVQLKAGLHVADVDAAIGITGVISVDGEPFSQGVRQEGGDVTAPLPHFGGNFGYAFNEKFGVNLHIVGLALEVNDIDGSIVDAGATLDYHFTDNFGVGAGVRYFNVDVEARDDDLTGKFEFEYLGAVVYASVAF